MVRWLPWRRGPNFERELPRLSDQIKHARAAAVSAQRRSRLWPVLLLIVTSALYVLYVASLVLTSRQFHPKHMAVCALTPIIIFGLHRILSRFLGWRKARLDAYLKLLVDKRKQLVEEYKQKTNFYEIQRLIQEDPQEQSKPAGAQSDKGKPHRGADSPRLSHAARKSTAANGPRDASGIRTDAKGPIATTGIAAQGIKGANALSSASAVGESAGNGVSATPYLEPVPVYHTSWVDRALDFLIGENESSPTNRYALICANCHAHNGLAPYGKTADEVVYRCPVCGFVNNADHKISETAENLLATTKNSNEKKVEKQENSEEKSSEETSSVDKSSKEIDQPNI